MIQDEQQGIKQLAQKIVVKLIEDVGLLHYVVIFMGIVISFAAAYYLLTPISQGIGKEGMPASDLSFWNATYFSVVTISSLGYGDMHPMGMGKFLAGLQVLLGLLLMGVMLAKLTSFRLAYHVSRLYSSELQKQLGKFSSDFEKYERDFRSIMTALNEAFRETPGKPFRTESPRTKSRFSELLGQFHIRCSNLSLYVEEESKKGAFFTNVPQQTLKRLAMGLEGVIFILGQLIVSLPPRGRAAVLDRDNRRRTAEVIAILLGLCNHVIKNSKDDETKLGFISVKRNCEEIPEKLYSIPKHVAVQNQPDQHLEMKDEPKTDETQNPGDK